MVRFIGHAWKCNGISFYAPKHSQSIYISSVPLVEFVCPEYTVAEDAGDVDVCLMIDHTISSPVIVRLYAFPDTAEGMKHYYRRLNYLWQSNHFSSFIMLSV